jgi:hypothetical protein
MEAFLVVVAQSTLKLMDESSSLSSDLLQGFLTSSQWQGQSQWFSNVGMKKSPLGNLL